MTNDDRDNIVQLFANAPEAPPRASVTNRNGVVIVGNTGGDVTINVTGANSRPARVPPPAAPIGAIDSGQQYQLKAMVAKIVRTSQKNTTHAKVWAALKKRYRIPRYDHLPADRFDDAHEYLRKWIGAAHGGRG